MPLSDDSVEVCTDVSSGLVADSHQAFPSPVWIPLPAARGARRSKQFNPLDDRFIKRLKAYRLRRAASGAGGNRVPAETQTANDRA